MKKDLRKEPRFPEIGRVDSPELCALSGVVENISLSGINVRFPTPVTLDTEREYRLSIRLTDAPRPLDLICEPKWTKEEESEIKIGFSVLRSPSTPELARLIESLEKSSKDSDASIESQLISTDAGFIE